MNIYVEILKQTSIQNDSFTAYINLCLDAQSRYRWDQTTSKIKNRKKLKQDLDAYHEVHHILPVSFNMGGEDDPENFTYLTPNEHYRAHLLLVEFTHGHLQNKMKFAFGKLSACSSTQSRFLTEDEYAVCRRYVSEAVSAFHTGRPKPKTAEHRKKLSESLLKRNSRIPKKKKIKKTDDPNYVSPLKGRKGKPMPSHVKEKLLLSNKGTKHSAERRKKHSDRMKGHKGFNNKRWKILDIIDNIEYFPISLRAFIRNMNLDDALYESFRKDFLYKGRYKVSQITHSPQNTDHS